MAGGEVNLSILGYQKRPLIIKVILTSSGTARMLLKPLRNTTNTRLAPHRIADVAQSNAVSPAPSTITLPCNLGSVALQPHMPSKFKIMVIIINPK